MTESDNVPIFGGELPNLLPLRPALNISMNPKLHIAGPCGHCASRKEEERLKSSSARAGRPQWRSASCRLISRGGKGNQGVIQSQQMKLFLEQDRNNTQVDEQGFVNEGRSFHMKRMDCEEFQNLKKAREKKKRLKCQNRGVDNSRGTFYSTIEEKIIKVNRKEKQYQRSTRYHFTPPKLSFQSEEIIRTILQFSYIHRTLQAFSTAEPTEKLLSAPSFQIQLFVGSVSNSETPWERERENLEPLTLSGDAFNPSILSKTIFKTNYFFLEKFAFYLSLHICLLVFKLWMQLY